LFVCFYKSGDQENKTGLLRAGISESMGHEKDIRKGCIWWKYHVHMYINGRMRLIEIILEMEEGR
jgi:hypothetical protein